MTSVFDSFKKKAIHYFQSFRRSNVLGIDREEDVLKMALVTKEKGCIHVSDCFTLERANKDFAIGRPTAERVATGLALHEVVFRSLILPLKTRGKVLNALPFQLETMLPFPMDQMIACPFLQPVDSHSTCISLIATSHALLNKHLNECTESGIRPDTVTCAPLALFRLSMLFFPEQKNLLFFHFGNTKISCIAVQDGQMTLSQSIRLGKADLILALQTTYLDKGQSDWKTLLSSPVPYHSPLASFFECLKSELERLSIFMKEKNKIEEATPWALIGDLTCCPALREIWKTHFTDAALPLDHLSIAEEIVHSHGLAIGFALDAFAADERSIQFLQGEFTPLHHRAARKKRAFVYAAACISLSALVALTSGISLHKRTRMLTDKMASFQLSKDAKRLSLSQIEEELQKAERSVQKQKSGFPFFLTVPKVSEVLAWLSTHPAFATSDGLPKEGIDIKNFRYQLIKYPTLEDASIPYQALVDIEFTATTPRLAREFHEALLKGDHIVSSKKELKWNTQGNVYSVQFELAKSASL